jgi:APA family basic amino acid/polyamine antiporter
MAAGAVFSISGNVSAMMLSGPRMIYAMSRSNLLPGWLGLIHQRYGTPANAIIFIGVLGLGLSLSGSFIWLAAMSTVVRLIVYAACIVSLPRIESLADPESESFKLPGGYLIPVTALLISAWLVTHASVQSWVLTILFVGLGSIFYWFANRMKNS